jgi:hypothetical protein
MVFPASKAFPVGSPASFPLLSKQASAYKTIVCLAESPTPQADALNGEKYEAEPHTRHADEKGNIELIGWSAKGGL